MQTSHAANPTDQQHAGNLVSAGTAQGTRVYNPQGDELGHIHDVLIEPGSGKIVYGVLEFGGFLGIGADHHPIPFARLRYDDSTQGYITDLTKEQLQNAPDHDDNWRGDRAWQEQSHKHYGVQPYWM